MEENAVNKEEFVSPQEIDSMDDEAFDAYIKTAKEADDEPAESGKAVPAEENAEGAPYMSFKTKEELQEYQNRTIGSRLREIREAGERERSELSELSNLAKERYKIADEKQAVSMLMRELEKMNAEKEGISYDEYSFKKEVENLRSEASYLKKVEDIRSGWMRQGEALKKIVPDFDLEEAFRDPEFYRLVVDERYSIAEAYPTLSKKPQRRAISEVGNLTNGVCGSITHDVGTMSDSEFDEYIRKIKNS